MNDESKQDKELDREIKDNSHSKGLGGWQNLGCGLIAISVAILCITLAVCAALLTHNVRILIHQVNDTATDIKDYVHAEKQTLEDPRNARAIEAAAQAGAVLNASGRLFNTQVIPRADRALDALTSEAEALRQTTLEAKAQLKQNGDTANSTIAAARDDLIALQTLEQKFGLDTDEAVAALRKASEQTGRGIEALTAQIANPAWSTAADNLAKTTGDADLVVLDIHRTTEQMPHTMAQVDKTATNISRFSKISIIAGIISNLANGVIPGLVR